MCLLLQFYDRDLTQTVARLPETTDSDPQKLHKMKSVKSQALMTWLERG